MPLFYLWAQQSHCLGSEISSDDAEPRPRNCGGVIRARGHDTGMAKRAMELGDAPLQLQLVSTVSLPNS